MMQGYLYCETLKTKRTFSRKLIFIAPMITISLAYLMGGPVNFQPMSLYWWYAFILYGFIAILCGLSIQKEQRAGKFYSVFSQPVNLSGFWGSKIAAIALFVLGANLILGLLVGLSTLSSSIPQSISPARIFLCSVVSGVCSLQVSVLCGRSPCVCGWQKKRESFSRF